MFDKTSCKFLLSLISHEWCFYSPIGLKNKACPFEQHILRPNAPIILTNGRVCDVFELFVTILLLLRISDDPFSRTFNALNQRSIKL